MKRTALLLGAVLLGSLLAAPPALAAKAPTASVARVKASPANQSGDCPTTVAFSATVAAKGKGTVRYRWVRGDGSKGAIKSFRVNGARKVVVRDRQTFDHDTTGWQAVEVLGKRGLSAKARFRVACAGVVHRYDVVNPLPAQPDQPLVVAASVQASPPAYTGACPTTVTFTATVQVSRTPAKVGYQWIDSATGEGPAEVMYFAAGGPRSRQVTLPLSVGGSTGGWKSVRILNAGGHDSGRATYEVTCKTTPAPTPTGTPTSRPTPTRTSTPTPTPTSTPTDTPTDEPPAKPEVAITGLTPDGYEGYCDEPIAFTATGRVTLPAGAAVQLSYWWLLDGVEWQHQVLDFPASTQPRTQNVSAAWSFDSSKNGTHKLGLVTDLGPAQPVERSFTLACQSDPQPANLTFNDIQTPVYQGDCTGSFMLGMNGHITTDKETDLRFRLVVDGKPGEVRTKRLYPGYPNGLGDFWYSTIKSSTTGKIRFEVLNHNKPVREAPYSVTCKPVDPNPGTVRISEFRPVAYYGDCAAAPYVTAHGGFRAAPGTEITYRWVVDGKPWDPTTLKTNSGGNLEVQAAYWHRYTKTSGVVKLEVLNHNKPSAEGVYPVTCQ